MELTAEQKKIVDFTGDLLVVKGTAGSGKSLVGLHRANRLLNKVQKTLSFGGDEDNRRVLFLTYTNSLVNDSLSKYKKLFGDNCDNITFMTVDKLMYQTIGSTKLGENGYKIDKWNGRFYDEAKYESILKNGIKDTRFELRFIKEEFDYIRENMFSSEEYYTTVRKNRELRLGAEERKLIFNLLIEYRKALKKDNKIDMLDGYIYLIKKGFKKDEHYTDILIDESQDLSKIKLMFILKLKDVYNDFKSLTLLYDTSQTIFKNSCLGNIKSFKSIGLNVVGRVKTLSFSYRSTRQIHLCAYSLLTAYEKNDKDNEVRVTPVFGQTDEGAKPVFVKCPGEEEESELFVHNVKILLDGNYSADEIIAIVPDTKAFGKYRDALARKGLKGKLITSSELRKCNDAQETINGEESIRFYNPYNIKGLEGKVIFILGAETDYLTDEQKSEEDIARLYYVQMTRAMEYLFIFSAGEPNVFINAINKKYLCELDYIEDMDINAIAETDVCCKKEFIVKNNVDRYKKVLTKTDEAEEKAAAYDKEMEEKEVKEKEELTQNEIKTRETYIEMARKEMKHLPEDIIRYIGEGMYYFDEGIDIEVSYHKFAKSIELVLKEMFLDKKFTFGEMVRRLMSDSDLKKYANEIYKLDLVKVRNQAVHKIMNDADELKIIQQYVWKDKKVAQLYDAISRIKEKESDQDRVEKNGILTSKGCTLKINGKNMYTYLINDDEYAGYGRKIKDGDYNLEGKYTLSRDKKIFIISSYKPRKIENATLSI